MKVVVIGSHLCPDTLYALNELSANHVEIQFKNMSASLPELKEYLAVRETSPLYESVKTAGGIGIPCFILEDGTTTLNLEDVLKLIPM